MIQMPEFIHLRGATRQSATVLSWNDVKPAAMLSPSCA
jgi:hypothetical protein